MDYKEGEIIEINDKEYIIYAIINEEETTYYYLMSNFKPVEILFAKSTEAKSENEMILINDTQEKIKVLDLFKKKFSE